MCNGFLTFLFKLFTGENIIYTYLNQCILLNNFSIFYFFKFIAGARTSAMAIQQLVEGLFIFILLFW